MGWIFRILIGRFIGRRFGMVQGVQAGYSVLKQFPAAQAIIRKVKKIVGWVLTIIGTPFVLVAINRYSDYGTDNIGWTLFWLILGLIFFIPGISFLISGYSMPKPPQYEEPRNLKLKGRR